MKLRARVLSKKGILASDPSIQQMNPTRWLFEAYQIRLADEEMVKVLGVSSEQLLRAVRQMLIGILGLNVIPVEEPDPADPEVDPEKRKKILRWAKEGEFTPMVFAVGRPDFVKEAAQRIDDMVKIDEAKNATSVIDGYSEDDLAFFDELPVDEQDAFWSDPATKATLDSIPVAPAVKPPEASEKPASKKRVVIDDD